MQVESGQGERPLVRFSFLSDLLGGDRDLMGEVVKIYEESATDLMNQIGGLLTTRDRTAARLAAHSLKGASASAGAERMRALSEELEGALRGADFLRADELLSQLRSNLRATLAAFTERFAEPAELP